MYAPPNEGSRQPSCHEALTRSADRIQQQPSKGADKSKTPNVRFVVVSNPDELRNPAELRLNRQHVMKDYLAKEASKPGSRDIRVSRQHSSRRRKRADESSEGASDSPSRGLSGGTCEGDSTSHGSDGDSTQYTASTLDLTEQTRSRSDVSRTKSVRVRASPKTQDSPLVAGSNGQFRNYAYLGTDAHDVPFPPQYLGGELDPFDAWPTFDDPSLRVNELKWSCRSKAHSPSLHTDTKLGSKRFGSRGIADYWVPTLLKARHAFLSTIAISSAHDDIMRRSTKSPSERSKTESVQRARVRHEVTSMINQSMSDPELQTSDATMVAVVHLLNAETMGCDDTVMRVHQQGLSAMVSSRGGLGALGVNGQLAAIVTMYAALSIFKHLCSWLTFRSTMYVIAVTRESRPQSIFVAYAESLRSASPKDTRPMPESPLYCRHTGYLTLHRVFAPESTTCKLLELARQLTNIFQAGIAATPTESSESDVSDTYLEQTYLDRMAVASEISDCPTAEDLSFEHMSQRYTYEAVRLTSRVYAHALLRRLPLSQAAQDLQATGLYRSLQDGLLSSEAPYVEGCAMHIHIRNALMRTDTTECWGHAAGVLFWIALVAGAMANPAAAPEGYVERRETGDDEDARKWLAAIVVRCSIVLGFEYGSAVMETVKRMVAIQQALTWSDTASC